MGIETAGGFRSPEEESAAEQFEAKGDANPEQREADLESEEGVVHLMQSSEDKAAWAANVDKVKEANNGEYPKFWHPAVIQSDLYFETSKNWSKK